MKEPLDVSYLGGPCPPSISRPSWSRCLLDEDVAAKVVAVVGDLVIPPQVLSW